MAYPSILSTLATPQATDRLNNPSHSTLHQNENSGILEVQRFVGTDASAIGTLVNDIRSPLSNGGGHVQTANKGGTGQTSYNKGDLLVGQSSSVLTKFAVGTDGQVLMANSSVASGITWAVNVSPKVAATGMSVPVDNTSTETSIFSVTIPGSTLGSSNVVRATVFVNQLNVSDGAATLTLKANYGSASIATIQLSGISVGQTSRGRVWVDLIGAGSSSIQTVFMNTELQRTVLPYSPASSFVGMKTSISNPTFVDSGASATFGLTATWNVGASGITAIFGGYEVERLV